MSEVAWDNDAVDVDGRVDRARAALCDGGTVVLVGSDRGAFLVTPAAEADPRSVARLVRLGSGYLVVAAPGEILDALELPPAVGHRAGAHSTYTVPFDAAVGISTGISARDRARTLSVIADPASTSSDLTRPGHVVATRTTRHGVLDRAAVAEAAADLAVLAGRSPAAAMCALLDETIGDPLTPVAVADLAARSNLPLVTVDDVLSHRLRHDPPLHRDQDIPHPTAFGTFTSASFRDLRSGAEHLALRTMGARLPSSAADAALVAVLVECRLGALGSLACGCADDRDTALSLVAAQGGIVLQLASDAMSTAPGGSAGIVAAVVGSLTRPHELSRTVRHPGQDTVERRPGLRLLRQATGCHASADALDRLTPQLRQLGVAVDAEVLLGQSRFTSRVGAPIGGHAA